jgi:MFS family permease
VAMKNMDTVLGDVRFVLFLVIFSSFFVVFWQEFISAPLFVRGYVDPNADVDLLLSVDALTVICFQILISYLTRRIRAFSAMTLGLLISSLGWLILAFHPSVVGFIAALVVVALGEITQVSRYYDYVSRLAPAGQEGLYMGYAFLPIAIGYFIAGPLGGYLLHYFGEVVHKPQQMWYAVAGVGVLGTVLMIIYDKALRPEESKMGRVGAAALARPGGGGDALPKRPKPRLIGVLAAIWLLAAIIQLAAPFMRGPRFVWVAVFFIVAWGTSKMYCWAWYANLIQCIGSFVIVSTGFSDRTGWYVVGLIAWAGLSALVATYLLLPVGRRAFGIRWSASSR